MQLTFQNEENEILSHYLNAAVYRDDYRFEELLCHLDEPEFQMGEKYQSPISGVELIIRPECNQKCEYCYIARYGHELYPVAERLSKQQILHNLDLYLTYVFDTKELYINHWELFAGDLFYDDLYFDICDCFYKHLIEKQQIFPNIFAKYEGVIVTPCNFSFIRDKDKKERVEEYITKFRQDLNWELGFSVSTDGKYAVDTREQIDLDDAYWDELFQWIIKYPRSGFHPMLSQSNIKNAIKNYKWWKEKYQEFVIPCDQKQNDVLPYWLMARNDEWTSEGVNNFLQLLDYMVNDRLVMCNNSVNELAHHLFCGDGANNTLAALPYFDLLKLALQEDNQQKKIGCSLGSLMIINLSNLAYVPCHRLTYPQFIGGRMVIENDKITDKVIAQNISGFFSIKNAHMDVMPKCANCAVNALCVKGCLGAQFEASGELYLPCISVCDLEYSTIEFLIYKYATMGVLQAAEEQGIIEPTLNQLCQQILSIMPLGRRDLYERIIDDGRSNEAINE